MAVLQDLPNETLILILRFLSVIDLQSTIRAQRVNRRFRDVIQDAVLHSPLSSRTSHSDDAYGSSGAEINPLLRVKFNGLFNSADCFTAAERARYWVLTLDGDATLPFRRLPWPSRDPFLRPEASWRELSPTFGTSPRTRRLDVVKSFESDTGSPVAYSQVELPDSGLSMGLLYDILLCEEAHYGPDTGSWQLFFGKSLKSFDVLYRWGCFIIDEPGESQLVRETPDAAILFVRGGEGCSKTALDQDQWMPQRLTQSSKPKFLPWQGPLTNPEDTEWFQ
ncbi:hypothetical protein E0Z10_g4546 [Xylaria hypoxylon]|uniref:F-box domain-containing protein n=1 Tax=Xylaria hypoxylon TaxID=37992 RepID=A0A4Z0YK38_9PEZI|nr:hypothetical protein E0Z10_g4546 [Xylaria hypoxylon]